MTEKSFIMLVLTLTLFGLLITALINYVVNPTAEFKHRIVPPIVQVSREEKTRLLRSFIKRNGNPRIVILGSSRSMEVRAYKIRHYLEIMTGQNWPAFHFGLDSANIEDYYASLRFILDEGAKPEILLIAQDFRNFNPSRGIDPRLFATPELYKYLNEREYKVSRGENLDRYKKLLSARQVANSIKSIVWLLTYNPPSPDFDDLGDLIDKSVRFKPLSDAEARKLAAESFEDEDRFRGYDAISTMRIQLLEEVFDLARQNGITVITWLTTVHPAQYSEIRRNNHINAIYMNLIRKENEIADRFPNVSFINMMNPSTVPCEKSDFKDLTHYSSKCADTLVIKYLIPNVVTRLQ